MQVILHIGVSGTDEDQLVQSLRRNVDVWRDQGIAIPRPERYRTLLVRVLDHLANHPAAPDAREVILDAILSDTADSQQVDRLVLSHHALFSPPRQMFAGGQLYHHAEDRLKQLKQIFAEDDLELFVGLRDPATLLPVIYEQSPQLYPEAFFQGFDPMSLKWSDYIKRLRSALPASPVTVWCNEDTPLLWGELLRRLAGVPLDRKVLGAFDLFSEIVSKEGMRRFRAFLKENPTLDETQKRRVMIAILGKYAIEDAVTEELDLPGWTDEHINWLSSVYDSDMATVRELPGVFCVEA